MGIEPGKIPAILAVGGLGIAGDRFNGVHVEKAVLPHFGEGVTWGDKALPITHAICWNRSRTGKARPPSRPSKSN